jgi:hypothetical protein
VSHYVTPKVEAIPTIYRGEPVLLLATFNGEVVVGAKIGDRDVRVTRSSVEALASGFGFRQLDRFLTDVSMGVPDALVAYGSLGIRFEGGRRGVNIRHGETPSAEWQELASQLGRVLVIVALQRKPTDFDLRTLLSSRRAFGGYASAMKIGQESTRYAFLGIDGRRGISTTDKHVFLDSNVLIHLEKVAQDASKDPGRDQEVQQVATQIAQGTVLGGFAIAELSWDRVTGRRNNERAASLGATVDAWFGDGSIARTRDLAEVRAHYREALAIHTRQPGSLDGSQYEIQLAYYACLLKIFQLWGRAAGQFRAVQRLELYEEFARWMMVEVGYSLSYPLRVAFDRFVGSQRAERVEYLDKLMKFGRNPSRELWGAAWDLAHLSSIDLSIHPEFRGAISQKDGGVLLVTDDKALPLFRERLRPRAVVKDNAYSLILMAADTEVDKRLTDHKHRIESIEAWIREEILSRQVGPLPQEYWEQLVRKCEAEVLGREQAHQDGVVVPSSQSVSGGRHRASWFIRLMGTIAGSGRN